MKKTIILLFISILALSCSKKNDDEIIEEPSLETFKISSEQTTIKPLELVLISSSEINFNLDSYKGKINDIEIDLIKTENDELLFTVPSVINIGSASLELIVENKKGKLSFNIIENNVQDVGSVINNELLTPFNEFESDLDDLIANNTNSLIVNEQLTSAKQMLQNYRTKYNALSNDEKIEVAKFFNANPVFTSDFLNLSNKNTNHLNGNSDYDCFKFNSKKVVYTTITILTFVNYLPHLTRVGPLGSVAALSGFIAGVYAAVAIISAAQEQLLNDCFLPFENLLKDDSGNTNNFELNNESNYTFSIISRDRKLISSDLNSSNSLLSSTVKRWNNAKQKWNKLKNGINNIISSTTNWFSSWFGSSSSFKTITYEFEDLPSSSDEIETEGDSEYISIEDFPSDVEVEYSIASDNSINLKFKADVSTLPRTITGKIKYDDNDFSNENEFSVTIDNQDPCIDNNAPIIKNLTTNCDPNRPASFIVTIDFETDGVGFNPSASYFGSQANSYPVRVDFLTSTWQLAANGYKAKLISGDIYNGTIEIEIPLCCSYINCEQTSYYNNEKIWHNGWKVYLVDSCGKESNFLNFEVKYFSRY